MWPVVSEGGCSACWAFAVVASIEGMYNIKYNTMRKFSEQQLIDCSTANNGCAGGRIRSAFKYIKDVGGLMRYNDYTYREA